MTLCIAWRKGGKIKFASDSRVSLDDEHYADIGIKIMQIPVKIKNPTPVQTGIEDVVYEYTLGMCYSGDTTNALLIKETIAEVLQNLQLHPFYTDFSLKGISRVITKFLENTSNHLKSGLDWDSDIEFMIGGYCPSIENVTVFKFQLVEYDDHYETICDEVLQDEDDIEIMGSGRESAEYLIDELNIKAGKSLLKVIRDVCANDSIPSVGGYLQYGHFENNNFKIFGVQDYKIHPDGEFEYIYAYRGSVLYKDKFEADESDYHIATTFITPFEDEINSFWNQNKT